MTIRKRLMNVRGQMRLSWWWLMLGAPQRFGRWDHGPASQHCEPGCSLSFQSTPVHSMLSMHACRQSVRLAASFCRAPITFVFGIKVQLYVQPAYAHSHNVLTPSEIWRSYAVWPLWPLWPYKMWSFKNTRWRRQPSWKIKKSPYLSRSLSDFD